MNLKPLSYQKHKYTFNFETKGVLMYTILLIALVLLTILTLLKNTPYISILRIYFSSFLNRKENKILPHLAVVLSSFL